MRFFRELFRPTLKCNRVGHKWKIVTKTIRKRTRNYGAVVEDSHANFYQCSRCGERGPAFNQKFIQSYASCSMPDSHWEELDRVGYLEI